METPDPPNDTPGALKQVVLTPHDIPWSLRVESIHHGHHSIQIRNQIPHLPILRSPCQKESSDQAMICGISVNWRKEKKHRHKNEKTSCICRKVMKHQTNEIVWGTLVDMASFAAICFFTCCESPLRHHRPGSSRLSLVIWCAIERTESGSVEMEWFRSYRMGVPTTSYCTSYERSCWNPQWVPFING